MLTGHLGGRGRWDSKPFGTVSSAGAFMSPSSFRLFPTPVVSEAPRRAGRLGRLPTLRAPALCEWTHYATRPLPPAPAAVVAPDLSWPMACNDTLGDCTIAAVTHSDQAWSEETHEPWSYPGDEAVT